MPMAQRSQFADAGDARRGSQMDKGEVMKPGDTFKTVSGKTMTWWPQDGLEAQCALIEELRYQIREAWPAPWSVEMFPLSEKAVAGFAAFIRTRDREIVERLEEQAKWWKRHHPDWNETETEVYEECADTILAVLAARNEGGG